MKAIRFLLATMFFAAAIGFAASAFAGGNGMNDSHGVWRDAAYWHERHPEWVYRYHPEWAVDRDDWWMVDHREHPGWFEYPYWRRYPVWTWGAYDRDHVWRGYRWWHERDAAWFYSHHPEWAEAHPYWIRDDHYRHPDWFRNGYWRDHPRDWNHPEEAYRRDLARDAEHDHGHPETFGAEHGNSYHGGQSNEHHNVAGAQYHASNQFHSTQVHSTTSSAATFHSSSSGNHGGSSGGSHGGSSGGGHSGHH